MAKVIVQPGEGLESALKRFRKFVYKDGIFEDYNGKRSFKSKQEKRHKKERRKK